LELNNKINVAPNPKESFERYTDFLSTNTACPLLNSPYTERAIKGSSCEFVADSTATIKIKLISKKSENQIVVDPKPYYINVRTPASGKTSATIKLNEQGFLTESEAEKESDLLGIIIDKIPISEIINSVLKLSPSAIPSILADTSATKIINDLKITITPIKRIYVCSQNIPISYSSSTDTIYNYEIKEVVGVNSSATSKKEENKNTIKLSGSIVLPEKK